MEVRDVLHEQEEQRNLIANRKRKERYFSPGDYVKIYRHVRNKLEPYWVGPYRVVRQTGPITYEVDLGEESRKHPIINAKNIRPWLFYQDMPNYQEILENMDTSAETEDPQLQETSAVDHPQTRSQTPARATSPDTMKENENELIGPITRARRKNLNLPLKGLLP
jgi:hypothetical protein